jgi:Lar family restriction alleviation protein
MNRLKSCPFCGGYAESHRPSDPHFAFVMCDKCGANTSNSDTLPEQDCIDAWNTRAPDPRVATLEAELARHQESQFNPDWSQLEATRAALREHQAQAQKVERLVALIRELTPCARYGEIPSCRPRCANTHARQGLPCIWERIKDALAEYTGETEEKEKNHDQKI